MNNKEYLYLLYQKDFTEKGEDRYFIYNGDSFSEVNSSDVVNIECYIVTHDFWLVANSLYKSHGKLPDKVLDVVLLSKIIAGRKASKGDTQHWDISHTIKPLFKDSKDFDSYISSYYRRTELDEKTYMLFSHKLAEYTNKMLKEATEANELGRFYSLELPVYNILISSASKGLRVSKEIIREHKDNLKTNFYRELKRFAEKQNVQYEIPNENEIKEKLLELGYDVKGYPVDFLIDFLPSVNNYSEDLRSLQKANKSYRVFNSISYSNSRLYPIVETHWTSTARIYHKSPSIQNISKKYRDIFIPDDGMEHTYVDYDQFEVGIMAALSNDPKMLEIYEKTDTYENLAELVFGTKELRDKAKVIFLSFTYGMSMTNILRSVEQYNGDKDKARSYFSEFVVYEDWKETLYSVFESEGKVETVCANSLKRELEGELTEKEKRMVVSHVIQGTGTFIFKKALLNLSNEEGVEILIPMHDAVLFQHPSSFDKQLAVKIFEETMTSILPRSLTGKASIEEFFPKKEAEPF
tara:strand:+ start:921 stop:2489 length:1569 start_codon:yes stop_codon:yes gene_type:complete